MDAVEVRGLSDFLAKLREVPRVMRRSVVRKALTVSMRIVRDAARAVAPVMSPSARRTPYRRPGTVKRAISVRFSRVDRQAGDIGVFVNVKPLPGNKYKAERTGPRGGIRRRLVSLSQRSAKNPNDPFYWRFLEFGTRFHRKRPFLVPASQKLPVALKKFETEIGAWTAKIDAKGKVTE